MQNYQDKTKLSAFQYCQYFDFVPVPNTPITSVSDICCNVNQPTTRISYHIISTKR